MYEHRLGALRVSETDVITIICWRKVDIGIRASERGGASFQLRARFLLSAP